MEKYRITSINRPLDPNYPTNRLILITGIVVIAIASLFHFGINNTVFASMIYGLKSSIAIFLVWAISREVDPDHEIAAFVPVVLSFVPVIIYGMQPLIALYWLLLISRIVNRSTGLKSGIFDTITAILITFYLSYEITWIFGILTASALFIDSRIDDFEKVNLFASIIMAATTLFAITQKGDILIAEFSLIRALALSSMALLFFYPLLNLERPQSKGDKTGEPLEAVRVKTAMVLLLLTTILFVLTDSAYTASWPVIWCIAAGIGMYRLIYKAYRSVKGSSTLDKYIENP